LPKPVLQTIKGLNTPNVCEYGSPLPREIYEVVVVAALVPSTDKVALPDPSSATVMAAASPLRVRVTAEGLEKVKVAVFETSKVCEEESSTTVAL